mmetsp:Transcript_22554/g.49401  ORF Transcript_22554/g.49401 Transcript_22554/m.49401 type:complete len:457 (+) Transcript_22554:86-1456(+)
MTIVERLMSEGLGTYMLVFTVGCNVLGGSPMFAALSIAAALMVSIYALGAVSGGHFNPAVSFTMGTKGHEAWVDMGMYMGVQIFAGLLAAFSYAMIFERTFNLIPGTGFGWVEAGTVETIYTFLLVFAVLNTAATEGYGRAKANNQVYGIAIGFSVVAGGFAAGWISGGCFNPAIAVAIDVSSAMKGVGWCVVYIAFELIGAVLAYLAFMTVRPSEGVEHGAFWSGLVSRLPPRLVAEFLGTFILVVTVGLNVLQGSGNKAAPLSISAALMVMVYCLGDVSGAHFNPAVTVAALLRGADGLTGGDAVGYIFAQCFGGAAGSLTYTAVVGKAFALGPAPGYGWASVMLAESVFTFLLCFVVLSVATLRTGSLSNMFGFAIGFALFVGIVAVGGVSGAALNPAVALAIDASHAIKGGSVWACLPYALAEIIGGAAAALVFAATRGSELGTSESKPLPS